jgi:hypothetical protein
MMRMLQCSSFPMGAEPQARGKLPARNLPQDFHTGIADQRAILETNSTPATVMKIQAKII